MKLRIAAGLLPLCLLLTACGNGGASAESPLGQAAGLDENETLLVIDQREIPAWQYLYWLAQRCCRMEEQYAAAETALEWTDALETLVKEGALADTVLYATVTAWAEAYGCTLTEEEAAALPRRTYPHLTEPQGQILTEIGRQYAKLYAMYQTEGSALAPSGGELEQFAEDNGILAAEQLLLPADEDREAAEQQAASLYAQINAAQEPDAVFESLLETYGGIVQEELWTETLRDAVSALEVGQISGIVAWEGGFSILRRCAVEPAALWEAHFDSLLRAAAEHSTIRCAAAYETLQPAAFWAALRDAGT